MPFSMRYDEIRGCDHQVCLECLLFVTDISVWNSEMPGGLQSQ
jgi:hypothetical protein